MRDTKENGKTNFDDVTPTVPRQREPLHPVDARVVQGLANMRLLLLEMAGHFEAIIIDIQERRAEQPTRDTPITPEDRVRAISAGYAELAAGAMHEAVATNPALDRRRKVR